MPNPSALGWAGSTALCSAALEVAVVTTAVLPVIMMNDVVG